MIQHITRNQLDEQKYNNCISNASNSRIYAYSWYLDIVCDDWDVLIKDDYNFVMPLPKRIFFGINYIYQAPWVQQLGIFSNTVIDESIVLEFIKSIPRKFKLIDIFFNSDSVINSKRVSSRKNFVLQLVKSYEILRKKYSKGRKSSIKRAQNSDLLIVEGYNHDEIIELFKQNKGIKLQKKVSDYDLLSELFEHALTLNFAKSYGIVNSSNKLIGGAFFLIDSRRITYLFSAINNEGRKKQAMSFLIDHVIKCNAESIYIFDFEGSMITELASFFKSFGAVKEEYFWYKRYFFR